MANVEQPIFDAVTVKEFAEFLVSDPDSEKPHDWKKQLENPLWPVLAMSAHDADAFAEWSGRRLPTEEEWLAQNPMIAYREWTSDADRDARVVRGGAWDLGPRGLRSSYRYRVQPVYRIYNLGFRCARAK